MTREAKQKFWNNVINDSEGNYSDFEGVAALLRETDEFDTLEFFDLPLVEKILDKIADPVPLQRCLKLAQLACSEFFIQKTKGPAVIDGKSYSYAQYNVGQYSRWLQMLKENKVHVVLSSFSDLFSKSELSQLGNVATSKASPIPGITTEQFNDHYYYFKLNSSFLLKAKDIPVNAAALQRIQSVVERLEEFSVEGKRKTEANKKLAQSLVDFV